MKNAFRLLLLILTINFSLHASAIQPSGDGTSDVPYQISSLDHLVWISINSSSWGAYFKQTTNIIINADETLVDWDGNGVADGSSP